MKLITSCIISCLFTISAWGLKSRNPDYLFGCWEKQVKSINRHYLEFKYKESAYRLYHSFEPWQQINTKTSGLIQINGNFYYQVDSLKTAKHVYKSQTQFDNKSLFYMGLGDTVLSKVTKTDYLEEPIDIARYSPVFIINKFRKSKPKLDPASTDSFAVYEMNINRIIVKLFIRKTDSIAVKITTLQDNDLYGDILNTYSYQKISKTQGTSFAKSIYIEKTNGKIHDTVEITYASFIEKTSPVITRPKGYKMADEEKIKPDFNIESYSDHIHFMNMKHTDDKVMIVEFKGFMLCAEAPLNSANGELIIREAQKIAPSKPIKYFVFCHFHPHYIGGFRAFVHKGSTILSPSSDSSYVQYLTSNQHTINPDSLQLQPRKLKLELIKDSLTITDGAYEMKIYFIGKKSSHTTDYIVYYFPKEKMLFEGDLVWIKKEGKVTKAGKLDAGLYNAIKDLKIDVNTIVQSWPVNNYSVKTVIPFKELEESVNLK